MIAIIQDDLVLAQVALDPDGLGREPRDARDLGPRLGRLCGTIYADNPPLALALAIREPGDHARLRGTGDRADDDCFEEHPELALLILDLARP